jgi:hypothetical protein
LRNLDAIGKLCLVAANQRTQAMPTAALVNRVEFNAPAPRVTVLAAIAGLGVDPGDPFAPPRRSIALGGNL